MDVDNLVDCGLVDRLRYGGYQPSVAETNLVLSLTRNVTILIN